VNVENPIAFSFIMQEDIYLLNNDKLQHSQPITLHIDNTVAEPEAPYIAPAATPVIETQPLSFKYLGGHKKNFLIVVHYQQHDFMHDKHLTALESTLTRLGFSMADVAIFNRAVYTDVAFAALEEFFKPQKMLLMGKNSLPAGIGAIELNKQTKFNNYPALLTFSFDEMMESVEYKKAFWEQMKQL
jgi:hypothetical protein